MFAALCLQVSAQSAIESDVLKQVNNPLASIKSVNIHNYYTPSMCGSDESANTLWLRYAQPIGKVLIRASLPVNTVTVSGKDYSGLGDLTVFGAYLLTKPTSVNQVGIGPLLAFPTATSSKLGTGKWQAGLAFAGYFSGNDVFQLGILATWQMSFAGKQNRSNAQMAAFQPFMTWQLGKGIYLRNSSAFAFDLENGNSVIPLGMGVGKILRMNEIVFNIFGETQFTVWKDGNNMPKTQLFLGINMQF